MVKYYGRAKMRTGSVNTIQLGLKMGGLAPTVGYKGTLLRTIQRRVGDNPAFSACGASTRYDATFTRANAAAEGGAGGYTCRYGLSGVKNLGTAAKDAYCVKKSTPCIFLASRSAGQAGGVGNIWTPRS
tara:strand:+ start:4794 stop:5180 length:387 start_codon:yes stop_codon:yes gene_type:complete